MNGSGVAENEATNLETKWMWYKYIIFDAYEELGNEGKGKKTQLVRYNNNDKNPSSICWPLNLHWHLMSPSPIKVGQAPWLQVLDLYWKRRTERLQVHVQYFNVRIYRRNIEHDRKVVSMEIHNGIKQINSYRHLKDISMSKVPNCPDLGAWAFIRGAGASELPMAYTL